jgi:hypothetical protein
MPTITASAGLVTIAVASPGTAWGSGYSGSLSVVLTTQDPCGPGPTSCTSTAAPVSITQLGG